MLSADLSPRNAPVATALLFGSRLQMDDDIRDAFVRTGLLHVLSISGMHVAILACLLWGLARFAGLGVRATSLAMIAGVIGYAFVTDCRPPVIRATILVSVYASTRLWFRRPALVNSLALAAIVVLLWNPSDLFDVGTQLSFLAVLGIAWVARGQSAVEIQKVQRPLAAIREERGPLRRAATVVLSGIRDEWRISLGA